MIDDSLNKGLTKRGELDHTSQKSSQKSSPHFSAMESTGTYSSTTSAKPQAKDLGTKSVEKKMPKGSSPKATPTQDTTSETNDLNEKSSKPSVVRDLFSLTIRRTRQRIKNNWNAKLASIILAILVWSIITANERATRQLTVPVPLTVLGQATISEVYPLPKTVEVRLSGPNNRLEDLKLRDLTATIDLRNVSGDFQVRVRVTRPRGIVIDSYEPEIVAGSVE